MSPPSRGQTSHSLSLSLVTLQHENAKAPVFVSINTSESKLELIPRNGGPRTYSGGYATPSGGREFTLYASAVSRVNVKRV